MNINEKRLNPQKGNLAVPIAIVVLVIAALALIAFSWWGKGAKEEDPATKAANATEQNRGVQNKPTVDVAANDDQTLDKDGASIDASLKSMDNSNADINSSLNDTPASL